MASIFYKWLIVFALTGLSSSYHPIFVSVTEIEHKAASKTLEITCKIFTDDFEKTLRKQYKTKIDLLDNKLTAAMNPLVNDYIKKHFSVIADGKLCVLNYLGFEQQEEGIVSYYEVKNIAVLKNVEVLNSILYEYSGQQMGIIHVTVNGQRKSNKLNNPDQKVSFFF
ncbi:MAG: DUF6702 family protein [Ferruginibacter sp.]